MSPECKARRCLERAKNDTHKMKDFVMAMEKQRGGVWLRAGKSHTHFYDTAKEAVVHAIHPPTATPGQDHTSVKALTKAFCTATSRTEKRVVKF